MRACGRPRALTLAGRAAISGREDAVSVGCLMWHDGLGVAGVRTIGTSCGAASGHRHSCRAQGAGIRGRKTAEGGPEQAGSTRAVQQTVAA